MYALIDADILCYEIGCMLNPDTGVPLPWPVIKDLVDTKLTQIQQETEAEHWDGFLTGKDNFRHDIATIKPYKAARGPRPFWYQGIYNYLKDHHRCTVVEGKEADDEISIEASKNPEEAVICSRDKDFLQVPGWHYTWAAGKQKEKPAFEVSELDGWRFFFSQCLTGDVADNIPGLYNVGEKSAAVQRVQAAGTELEAFEVVKKEYELRFGSYWDMFLYENGTLLWLLRSEDDNWYKRQKEFTCQL